MFDEAVKITKNLGLTTHLATMNAMSNLTGLADLSRHRTAFDEMNKITKTLGLTAQFAATNAMNNLTGLADLSLHRTAFDEMIKVTKSLGLSQKFTALDVANSLQMRSNWPGYLAPLDEITKSTNGLSISLHSSPLTEVTKLAADMTVWQRSPAHDLITKAMFGLPSWLKPQNELNILLPSWNVAASMGIAGLAPAGLIHDVLGAVHQRRTATFAFEAAVKMAETIDAEEQYLAETTLSLLRQFASMLVDMVSQTKDFIQRQGYVSIIVLIISIAGLYETHLSRESASEQTDIAREQLELGRAVGTSDSTAIQLEILEELKALELRTAQLRNESISDENIRIVAQMAPLRSGSDAKAHMIRRVYPDDRVRIKDVKNGWALVEVYEYKSEATTTGWINKRVLRRLPN